MVHHAFVLFSVTIAAAVSPPVAIILPRQQQTTDGTDAAQNVYFYFSVHNDGKQKSIYPSCLHIKKGIAVIQNHMWKKNRNSTQKRAMVVWWCNQENTTTKIKNMHPSALFNWDWRFCRQPRDDHEKNYRSNICLLRWSFGLYCISLSLCCLVFYLDHCNTLHHLLSIRVHLPHDKATTTEDTSL